MPSNTVHIVCGPTAGGKSALALAMAREMNGIVINADSMQIYNALPVLTARPTGEEQEMAPHRLYGILPPQDKCTAQCWRDMAVAEIGKAFAEDLTPIVVGGTGFYLKTLMEGLSPIPQIPAEAREKAKQKLQELGNPAFHQALAARDPQTAAKLHPNDTQRLIRAWEVLEATGKGLAAWQELPAAGAPFGWEFAVRLVSPPRDVLYRRCDERFDAMMARGVLEEVRELDTLIEAGDVAADAAITKALGFRPLQDCIQGRCTFDAAIAAAKYDTRHYAKRQATWFRSQL